jgi:5-(carboxyamino)imidazole ribonucleotide synthase
MIEPGKTIGMLGAGQLGKMSLLAARRMGYRFTSWDPDPAAPAMGSSDEVFVEKWDDLSHAADFARAVDVVSCEFENVPAGLLQAVGEHTAVRPGPDVFAVCQRREKEKKWLARNGFPHAPFRLVTSAEETVSAVKQLRAPCILKSARWGYDGKGQHGIEPRDDPAAIWKASGLDRAIVEKRIDFQAELSVICARRASGESVCFPVAENQHVNGILDITIAPGRFDSQIILAATQLALRVAETFELEGVLAVEMFLTTDGELLVNEMAPRPHNSGHFTIEACLTSQFDQHVRSICDLPLAGTALVRPAVMVNLLGDLWATGKTPDWTQILREPGAYLHLYGKAKPRAGRKMGHFTVTDQDSATALKRALEIRKKLRPRLRALDE